MLARSTKLGLRVPLTVTRAMGSASHPTIDSVSDSHWEDSWNASDLTEASGAHCMASWGPGAALRGLPLLSRGEGVHLYDNKGNKFIDWTSQAVCVNLGYTMPDEVKAAITHQASHNASCKTVSYGRTMTTLFGKMTNPYSATRTC